MYTPSEEVPGIFLNRCATTEWAQRKRLRLRLEARDVGEHYETTWPLVVGSHTPDRSWSTVDHLVPQHLSAVMIRWSEGYVCMVQMQPTQEWIRIVMNMKYEIYQLLFVPLYNNGNLFFPTPAAYAATQQHLHTIYICNKIAKKRNEPATVFSLVFKFRQNFDRADFMFFQPKKSWLRT